MRAGGVAGSCRHIVITLAGWCRHGAIAGRFAPFLRHPPFSTPAWAVEITQLLCNSDHRPSGKSTGGGRLGMEGTRCCYGIATALLRHCYGIAPMWVAQLTDFTPLARLTWGL